MRLIDADEFKEYCKEGLSETLPLFNDEKGRDFAKKVTDSFLMDIDEQPTIEIVRCRECKMSHQTINTTLFECHKLDVLVSGGDYCCWGSKRHDDTD